MKKEVFLLNKKGISPLIATILVIGITVIIAVLVTTWLQGSTEGLKCTQECTVQGSSACQFSFGELEAAYDSTTDKITVTNTGSTDYDLTYVVTTTATGATITNGVTLGGINGFSTNVSAAVGSGQSIKVIAGVTPEVEGCADCEFVSCWESEDFESEA